MHMCCLLGRSGNKATLRRLLATVKRRSRRKLNEFIQNDLEGNSLSLFQKIIGHLESGGGNCPLVNLRLVIYYNDVLSALEFVNVIIRPGVNSQ